VWPSAEGERWCAFTRLPDPTHRVATGIEEPFLTAYREGSFHYLLIAADRV
jgi:hypothetical protein